MTYYWKAKYQNGKEISSRDGNKYKNIDKGSLKQFILLCEETDEPIITLEMGGNKRLILFMRVAVNSKKQSMRIWVVGHQEIVQGSNVQELHFVFPDGTIEVADSFKENHRWHNPPSRKHMERFE